MKLKFILDKQYDREKTKLFLGKKDLVYFDSHYDDFVTYLNYSKTEYQKSWNQINDAFSKYIETVTGYKWFASKYECVVSLTIQGMSNWYDPKVVRGWKEHPLVQRRITAHELIIHHYFEIYRHSYSDNTLSDDQIWALAEIAAWALTSLTEESRTFWPWDRSGYYYTHNYPELVELQKKLKNPFLKRKNFDQYIEKGIRFIQESYES
ncbi:TPA: hypothetical protein DCW61_04195 [Candidatus Uhrbacteria bacterium]|nr:hypothetical protein [Candidatus Uhrbacteria bacterium]